MITPAPHLRFEPFAVIEDREVVLGDAIELPGISEPVRYVGGVNLPELIRIAADCRDVPSLIRLLRIVAEKAGWQSRVLPRMPRPASVVSGRGVSSDASIAAIADVDVNLDSGSVRVRRAVIAAWAGRIVNPEGMRHQVEGAFLQGLSRALFEEVTFDGGRVTSVDWRRYPILRFPDVPVVETVLVDEEGLEFAGLGELATGPAPASIGNAIFEATGVRLRQVPFTPARVKAGLARV